MLDAVTLAVKEGDTVVLAVNEGDTVVLAVKEGDTVVLAVKEGEMELLPVVEGVNVLDPVSLAVKLGEMVVLAVKLGEIVVLAVKLGEMLVLAVKLGEMLLLAVSDDELEPVALMLALDELVCVSEAVTLSDGVGDGVPLQTQTPLANEPQEIRQHSAMQGVKLGLTLELPVTDGTVGETVLLCVALAVSEADMHVQVNGNCCKHW